jgi:hypothetical protein
VDSLGVLGGLDFFVNGKRIMSELVRIEVGLIWRGLQKELYLKSITGEEIGCGRKRG